MSNGISKLLASLHPPRSNAVPPETLARIIALRKNGHSKDQIRDALRVGSKTVERAFVEYGGDPIPEEMRFTGRKRPPPVERTKKIASTPVDASQFRAPRDGYHMPPAIQWHVRCGHGRVEQFCTDCRRDRA